MDLKHKIVYGLVDARGRLSDIHATLFHMAKHQKRINSDQIKVGFIVHETETWDNCRLVYEEMDRRSIFTPMIFVCPSYNEIRENKKAFGYEWEYFSAHYPNTYKVYDDTGNIIDLKSHGCDYLFYQDPYIVHYPEPIRPGKTAAYSKLCYIPYGLTHLNAFTETLKRNRRFFGTLTYAFMDSEQNARVLADMYKTNCRKGLQHFLYLGYPALAQVFSYPEPSDPKPIVWTPRWTFDPSLGKSHFLDYKDAMLTLPKLHPDISLTLRPHPLMYTNIIESGLMSKGAVEDYKQQLISNGIRTDLHSPINDVLKNTSILITDISSIIIQFFLTGRPMIYCECNLEKNDMFKEILKGIYVANSWEDIENYLSHILNGDDFLYETRQEIINRSEFKKHITSASAITDTIQNNWIHSIE